MTEHSNLHTLVDIVSIAASLALAGVVLWWTCWQDKRIQAIKSDVARLMREYPVSKPATNLVLQEWASACCGTRVLIQEQKGTLMLKLKKGDVRTLRIKPVDRDGNATMLDGAALWVSSDPTAVLIEANADGLSATLRVLKANTDAEISVSGDGSHGDTVLTISGTMPVHVFPEDAVGIAISTDNETVVVTQEVPVVDVPTITAPAVPAAPEAPVSGSPAAPVTETTSADTATTTEAPKSTGTEPVSNSDTPPPAFDPATPGGPSGPPPSDA